MKPVASTSKILAFKILNRDINKQWVDWAIEMLMAGYDTENLAILAGELEPYNQFELQRLTDKILIELNLKIDNEDIIIKNYICYLIDRALDNEMSILSVLDELKDFCIDFNYDKNLFDFYLLFFAKDDLKDLELTFHWPGADRVNIDTIIREYFIKYKNDCCGAK
jgi:hypothetical protein